MTPKTWLRIIAVLLLILLALIAIKKVKADASPYFPVEIDYLGCWGIVIKPIDYPLYRGEVLFYDEPNWEPLDFVDGELRYQKLLSPGTHRIKWLRVLTLDPFDVWGAGPITFDCSLEDVNKNYIPEVYYAYKY